MDGSQLGSSGSTASQSHHSLVGGGSAHVEGLPSVFSALDQDCLHRPLNVNFTEIHWERWVQNVLSTKGHWFRDELYQAGVGTDQDQPLSSRLTIDYHVLQIEFENKDLNKDHSPHCPVLPYNLSCCSRQTALFLLNSMPFVMFLMLISPRFTPTAAPSAFLQLLSFIFTAGVRDDYF